MELLNVVVAPLDVEVVALGAAVNVGDVVVEPLDEAVANVGAGASELSTGVAAATIGALDVATGVDGRRAGDVRGFVFRTCPRVFTV